MVKLWTDLRLDKYFLSGVFIFAYFQSVQTRIAFSQPVTNYTFTPEAAVVSFIAACVIFTVMGVLLKPHERRLEKSRPRVVFEVLLGTIIVSLVIFNLMSLLTALAFGNFHRNFTWPIFARNNMKAAVDICIYGSFYLTYQYYQKNKEDGRQLAAYHSALSDSKIARLKLQLNPHFLFNNLNILDQLIEENAAKASCFLNDFSDLYRYSLQTSDKKLVPVSEELQFAEMYFRLIEHKFEGAYSLYIEQKIKNAPDSFIPPFALQLLIENVVEHNLGTAGQPVNIRVEVGEDFLTVANNRTKMAKPKMDGGRSLHNLREQYNLLTDAGMKVTDTGTEFCVQLPVIKDKSV